MPAQRDPMPRPRGRSRGGCRCAGPAASDGARCGARDTGSERRRDARRTGTDRLSAGAVRPAAVDGGARTARGSDRPDRPSGCRLPWRATRGTGGRAPRPRSSRHGRHRFRRRFRDRPGAPRRNSMPEGRHGQGRRPCPRAPPESGARPRCDGPVDPATITPERQAPGRDAGTPRNPRRDVATS